MNVLIVQHVEDEGPGTIVDFLDQRGIAISTARLFAGDSLPKVLDGISRVVVLGGPMFVYEEDKYPYLKEEDAFIKRVLGSNIPYLGICLGAQLLAKACGARVYKAIRPEIGAFRISRCGPDTGGILASLPETFPSMHIHSDTFDIPTGGTLLATSKDCPNQAFVVNESAYGLQFHPELNERMVREWYDEYENRDEIINDYLGMEREYRSLAWEIYSSFFNGRLR